MQYGGCTSCLAQRTEVSCCLVSSLLPVRSRDALPTVARPISSAVSPCGYHTQYDSAIAVCRSPSLISSPCRLTAVAGSRADQLTHDLVETYNKRRSILINTLDWNGKSQNCPNIFLKLSTKYSYFLALRQIFNAFRGNSPARYACPPFPNYGLVLPPPANTIIKIKRGPWY